MIELYESSFILEKPVTCSIHFWISAFAKLVNRVGKLYEPHTPKETIPTCVPLKTKGLPSSKKHGDFDPPPAHIILSVSSSGRNEYASWQVSKSTNGTIAPWSWADKSDESNYKKNF